MLLSLGGGWLVASDASPARFPPPSLAQLRLLHPFLDPVLTTTPCPRRNDRDRRIEVASTEQAVMRAVVTVGQCSSCERTPIETHPSHRD